MARPSANVAGGALAFACVRTPPPSHRVPEFCHSAPSDVAQVNALHAAPVMHSHVSFVPRQRHRCVCDLRSPRASGGFAFTRRNRGRRASRCPRGDHLFDQALRVHSRAERGCDRRQPQRLPPVDSNFPGSNVTLALYGATSATAPHRCRQDSWRGTGRLGREASGLPRTILESVPARLS